MRLHPRSKSRTLMLDKRKRPGRQSDLCRTTAAACHGNTGQGAGNVPPLARGTAQNAPDGAIFWYITQGDVNNGMPSWASMPAKQRWEVVTFLKTLNACSRWLGPPVRCSPAPAIKKSIAPPPHAPFTDYRFEKPGVTRHIKVEDLPEPYATQSATAGPKVVARPQNAWPKAPHGFQGGAVCDRTE